MIDYSERIKPRIKRIKVHECMQKYYPEFHEYVNKQALQLVYIMLQITRIDGAD